MFKSGYIALLGCPNVGKSTLLNQILEKPLSIVTPKPQTTRHKILGIKHFKKAQLVFLDTPGFHEKKGLLNAALMSNALQSFDEADIVLHLIEPTLNFKKVDLDLARTIRKRTLIYILVINKVDLIDKNKLLPIMGKAALTFKAAEVFPICAKRKEGIDRLLLLLQGYLKEGPAFFPEDQYTDRSLRFLVAEKVREKATQMTYEEIPYGLTVEIDEYREGKGRDYIAASIIVEKTNHRPILLGKKGEKIKKIGQAARIDIEHLVKKKVYLQLFVKVVKDWTKSKFRLRDFGIKDT